MEQLLPCTPPPQLPPSHRWRVPKVKAGTHGPYMKAGVGWFGTVHYSGDVTKPCVAVLTNGKLACPWCKKPKRFGTYVPVFSCGNTKQIELVIQGAKRTRETWDTIEFGQLVTIVKGKAQRDTVLFVKAERCHATADLSKLRARGPQDIGRYLLHLWQYRPLTEFFGEDFLPSIRTEETTPRVWNLADGGAKPADSE